ncbi:MAG: hypothetical protein HYZ73_01050 [Elusimicrobia bacterium]|nr:hypothetical protein [Elusimicrobiota bacterium]
MAQNIKKTSCKIAALTIAAVLFLGQLIFVDQLRLPFTNLSMNHPWTGLAILSLLLLVFHVRQQIQTSKSPWTGKALFFLTVFMFLSNFRWHGSDDLPTSLLPFNILQRGTFTLDHFASWFTHHRNNLVPGKGGHLVSFFPILGAMLALPVYLLPALRGIEPTNHVVHQLEKISASLICAVAVWVLYRIYQRKVSPRWAFGLALVYALGTNMFSLCSQALWQYGPSCLMVVLSLWALDLAEENPRYWYACGCFAALAVGARDPNVIFFCGFGLAAFLRQGLRSLGRFTAGSLIPGLLLAAYWTSVVGTGLPAELGFQTGLLQFPPSLAAAAGLLISPARGIVWFSPVVLFGLLGVWRALKHGSASQRQLALALFLSVVASFTLLASYQAWGGGFTHGPRYLIESVTVLFYFLPQVVGWMNTQPWVQWFWRGTVIVSIGCHALGAYATWGWEDIVLSKSVWNIQAYPPIYLMMSSLIHR